MSELDLTRHHISATAKHMLTANAILLTCKSPKPDTTPTPVPQLPFKAEIMTECECP